MNIFMAERLYEEEFLTIPPGLFKETKPSL